MANHLGESVSAKISRKGTRFGSGQNPAFRLIFPEINPLMSDIRYAFFDG